MDEKLTVKVLLNMSSFLHPYSSNDQLMQALMFETRPPACGHIAMLLRIVFEQCNHPAPRADWARQYRTDGNRSLSVGDVIVIGEQAYAIGETRFEPVSIEASQVWHDALDGIAVVSEPLNMN